MPYLFGDTDIAAQRLQVLGEVFAESSKAFLLGAAPSQLQLAVDLGCGPGYSTHFLANILQCDRIVGLDNSEQFIALAQRTRTAKVVFALHDVTVVPFPIGPADLFYCRFLLTHLREPQAVIMKWATQLQPNGLLVIEENEGIQTDHAVFITYIRMVETLLQSSSTDLYVGASVNRLNDTDTLKKRASHKQCVTVLTKQAATLFFLNMQSWKHHPFIRTTYPPTLVDQLEHNLHTLIEQSSRECEIEWQLRQLVFERI
jgi:SAM-dependent methyltransferase